MQTTAAAPATPDSSTNFAANPDLLANMSDDQLDALAGTANEAAAAALKVEQGETNASATPGADGKPTEKPAETQPGDAAKPATAAAGPEKEVLAQDGKHTIPYSVLERERNRAVQAEATAAALAEEVKQLQAGKKPDAESAAAALSEEDLAQLDQDLPGVAKVIRAQMTMIEQLTGSVKSIKAGQDVQERSAEQVRIDAEEAAIAANPELVALRTAMAANDPKATARWNTVVDAYGALQNDPDLVGLPTADLINRAAHGIKALYGGNLLPAGVQVAAASSATPTEAELKAKADAALAAAEKAGAATPHSLGDIPGGSAPATDEAAAMLGKSGAQLTAEFMTMTPEQIEAKLNRLR